MIFSCPLISVSRPMMNRPRGSPFASSIECRVVRACSGQAFESPQENRRREESLDEKPRGPDPVRRDEQLRLRRPVRDYRAERVRPLPRWIRARRYHACILHGVLRRPPDRARAGLALRLPRLQRHRVSRALEGQARYNLACAYARTGDPLAEAALELAITRGGETVRARAAKDKDFDGVRGAPWFAKLTRSTP